MLITNKNWSKIKKYNSRENQVIWNRYNFRKAINNPN